MGEERETEFQKLVLVVDDNPTVRKFITGVLQPLGYNVRSSPDGMQALAEVARRSPDLILLDLVMPRLNGYQFLRALEQKRLAQDAKIVILSSAREEVARKVQQATRVDEALPKPVKAQQLRALVEKYIPLSDQEPEVGEIEFDISTEESGLPGELPSAEVVPQATAGDDGQASGGPIDELTFGDEVTSDDTISSPLELTGILRDKLDTAVAEGLADRLDDIMSAGGRDEVLALMAEVLASVVNDRLVQRMIDLVRDTYAKDSATNGDDQNSK